jgi:hypothetical protein
MIILEETSHFGYTWKKVPSGQKVSRVTVAGIDVIDDESGV